jgi:hypothetical protein
MQRLGIGAPTTFYVTRLESKQSFQWAIAASSRPCYFSRKILPLTGLFRYVAGQANARFSARRELRIDFFDF